MVKIPSIMNARYEEIGPDPRTGYLMVKDRIHEKQVLGRRLPLMPQVEENLIFWSRISHPCFLQLFRYLVDDQGYLVIMRNLGEDARPLDKLKVNDFSAEELVSIFHQLVQAFRFLSLQKVFHPRLDLSKVMVQGQARVQIIGHETCVPVEWLSNNMKSLDSRYLPPELFEDGERSEKSDIYHLGALWLHFLTGLAPKQHNGPLTLPPAIRKQRAFWTQLLAEMLKKDIHARPDWKELLEQIQKAAPKEDQTPAPVWHGFSDKDSVQKLEEIAFLAQNGPQAVALQVFPGREKVLRLSPFTRWAETQNFLVFHTWISERPGKHYTVINQIMLLLREGASRLMKQTDLSAELVPLSEWQFEEEMIEKWRGLLWRIFSTLVPEYGKGIVLIIEDIQNIDKASLETLLHFSEMLGETPFMLVLTSNSLANEHLQALRRSWPYQWHYLKSPPLNQDRLGRLLGEPEAETWSQLLADCSEDEVLTLYQLEDRFQSPGLFDGYLSGIWRSLSSAQGRILALASCSRRPLSQDAFQKMHFKNAAADLASLTEFRLLTRVNLGDEVGYEVGIPVLRRYFLDRIETGDLVLIRRRLLEYEQAQSSPDPIQVAFLGISLNGKESWKTFVGPLQDSILENLNVTYLRRLDQINASEPLPALGTTMKFVQAIQGQVLAPGSLRISAALAMLSSANRYRGKREWERFQNTCQKLTRKHRTPLGLKALAYFMVAEATTAGTFWLTRMWRQLRSGNFDSIDQEVRAEWTARLMAIAKDNRKLADFCATYESLPENLKAWIEGVSSYEVGDFEGAVANLARAMPRVLQSYDLNWQGVAQKLYGNSLFRLNKPEAAINAYNKANTLFRKTNNLAEIENTRFNLASAEVLAGRYALAIASFKLQLQEAVSRQDEGEECLILMCLLNCALCQNHMKAYEEHWRRFVRLAEKLRKYEEMIRGLTLRLHLAFILSKDEVIELMKGIKSLVKKCQLRPIMVEQVEIALRLGKMALGEPEMQTDRNYPRSTAWRHRFLDFLAGDQSHSLRDLVEGIGSGSFAGCHFFVLHTAIRSKMIPKDHFGEYLVSAFENYSRKTGSLYGSFIEKHFRGVHNLKKLPGEVWEQPLRIMESISWKTPNLEAIEKQLHQGIHKIWPFENWGYLLRHQNEWISPFQPIDKATEQHLENAALMEMTEPTVTTTTDFLTQQTQNLLILPISARGDQSALMWFSTSRAAAHDLEMHYNQIFRLYGRLFDYLFSRKGLHPAPARQQEANPVHSYGIIGNSSSIRDLLVRIQRFAPSSLNIFIFGESGTGKELAAQAFHLASDRAQRPFRAVNCSHFPDTLVESALFGHARGAFTGANTDKAGILELVNGGTLFLDEIADINPKVQSLLLRVFQEGEFSRVGETRVRKVDIRFVTATNRDLVQLIRQGSFREDLYYRMVGEEIRMPPLRMRTEDMPLLADYFARKHEPKRKVSFARNFFDLMAHHGWPGNVREFETYIRKVLVHWPEYDRITEAERLPFLNPTEKPEPDLATLTLEQFDNQSRSALLRARLARYSGNRTQTAVSLGISRQQLANLINKHKLQEENKTNRHGDLTLSLDGMNDY